MSDRGDRSASEERQKSRSPDENGRKDRSRSKSRSKSHKAHSYSRSRSRSRSHSWSRSKSHSSHSRSRSRSRSRNSRRKSSRSRSRSPYYKRRSPMSKRKRHYGSRDDPPKSNCLGIFGLSLYTTERDLKEFLEKYGTVSSCQLVYDHQSGRSRGFAFAYFPDSSEAEKVKEETSGLELDGRRIRVDYSITQRAHTPTPGVYMGKPSQSRDMDKGKRFHNRRSDDYGSRDNYSRDRYRERDYGSRDYGSRDTYSSRDRDYYSRSRSRSPRRY